LIRRVAPWHRTSLEDFTMREFAIQATHRPGEIGRVANILGRAGVNLKAVAAMAFASQGVIRLVVDDVEAARGALQQSNIRFEEHEVVSVLLENRAGELADMADKLANAGVNLLAVYLTGRVDDLVELAVVADDPKRAKKLLE
jgi:hypothetical protein